MMVCKTVVTQPLLLDYLYTSRYVLVDLTIDCSMIAFTVDTTYGTRQNKVYVA